MEQVIVQVAIQVPALALVVFFSGWVLRLVLDIQGRKIDRLSDAVEKLVNEWKQ